ncbi:hypothetical protein MHY85_10845 [Cellulomonas sp. ACRRI]|uniref:hypothetical protein n=1 Tax=Cellulomonas sp. ACRRI TaxID=2918188 RepID=UPI001EF1F805|nr:hypothetical protein [Cellulomonas sp. ACRRI]MCG7286465.1 hypothetical protein [Cellulomonas sp. ACRRI]
MNQEERIARARAALVSAELRTGARSMAPRGTGAAEARRAGRSSVAPPADVPGDGPSAVLGARPGRVREEGARPAARADAPVQGATALAVVPVTDPDPASAPSGPVAVPDLPDRQRAVPRPTAARGPVLLTDRPPLAVPPALTPLLPDGLRRGSTTAVLGSTSLVLAMIAAACTAREAWAAVVGQPSLGLLAAAQTGVALERLAVVPQPGVDAPTVVAALLDGIDVVVVGPGAHLADADRRRLMARARDRGSVLLATAPWPGAGTVLTVEGGRWTGVGEGDGRLRAHEVHVTRTGRGSAGRAQDLRVVLPLEVGTDPYGLPADRGSRADGPVTARPGADRPDVPARPGADVLARPAGAVPAASAGPEPVADDGALLAPDLRLVG